MMLRSLCLTLFGLVFSLATSAQDSPSYTLEGTLGKTKIVMSISGYEGELNFSSYFYAKYRKRIPLSGTYAGFHYQLNTTSLETEEIFDLTLGKDGNWTGTWKSNKKSLPVKLSPVNVKATTHNLGYHKVFKELMENDPYTYLQSKDVVLTDDTIMKIGSITYKVVSDRYRQVPGIRIISGYSPEQIKKLNAQLETQHFNEIAASYSCASPYGEGEYSTSIFVSYASPQFFSGYTSTYWDCGGAHPDGGINGFTYDVNKGSSIELEDILYFAEGNAPDPDSDAWMNYRTEVFAPSVVQVLTDEYPSEMTPAEGEEDCNYADPEVWNFVPWYLTNEGIYVGAYFYRAARMCDSPEWSIMPYKSLRKWLRGGYKF